MRALSLVEHDQRRLRLRLRNLDPLLGRQVRATFAT
jgi:hypothetical protein